MSGAGGADATGGTGRQPCAAAPPRGGGAAAVLVTATLGGVRARHLLVGAALAALLLAAMVVGGAVGSRSVAAAADNLPCHAQVNCIGQIANTPLGSSMLPVSTVAVVAALVVVSRLDVTPSRRRDRLVAGRLFRPPRALG
jgi:hypothetical protein